MRKQQKGFSLIELLIVVAIILIIAAIAIPNLMRASMAANDSSAAASERTIVTGEIGYFAAYPTVGYTHLVGPGWGIGAACTPGTATACLIDNNLANNGTPAARQERLSICRSGQLPARAARFRTSSTPLATPSAHRLVPSRIARLMTAWFARLQRAPSLRSASYGACQALSRWRTNVISLAKYLGEGTSRRAAKATSLLSRFLGIRSETKAAFCGQLAQSGDSAQNPARQVNESLKCNLRGVHPTSRQAHIFFGTGCLFTWPPAILISLEPRGPRDERPFWQRRRLGPSQARCCWHSSRCVLRQPRW